MDRFKTLNGMERFVSLKSPTVSDPEPEWSFFKQNSILHGRFKILRLVGKGGFGFIYKAFDYKTQKYVAVKVEKKVDIYPSYTMLHLESFVFMTLHKSSPAKDGRLVGFPKNYFFGFINPGEKTRMLVMDLLGPSLHELFALCNYRFSLSTVLLIADQLLDRIESFHKCGIIHRDLKPENILIGRDHQKNVIYVIDFGLALVKPKSEKGTTVDDNGKEQPHLGTFRYMSCRAHCRLMQTKKDDLESLVYILAALLNSGRLPWLDVNDEDKNERHKKICEMKRTIEMRKLFENNPWEFRLFGEKVKRLRIDEEPPYDEYRRIFRRLGLILGVNYDARKFDWSGFEGSVVLSDFEGDKPT